MFLYGACADVELFCYVSVSLAVEIAFFKDAAGLRSERVDEIIHLCDSVLRLLDSGSLLVGLIAIDSFVEILVSLLGDAAADAVDTFVADDTVEETALAAIRDVVETSPQSFEGVADNVTARLLVSHHSVGESVAHMQSSVDGLPKKT